MSRELFVSDTLVSDVDLRVRRLEARVAKLERHVIRLSAALESSVLDASAEQVTADAGSPDKA